MSVNGRKTCTRKGCGRVGIRGFTTDDEGNIVCANLRACRRRSRHYFDGYPRGARWLKGSGRGGVGDE